MIKRRNPMARTFSPNALQPRSGLRVLDELSRDLVYGLRMLLRNPGFALIVIFTLGLGIGVNTAIFSVVDAVLWRPFPTPAPEQLAALYTSGGDGSGYRSLSYPDFLEYQSHQKSFVGMAAYVRVPLDWREGDRIERIGSELVTGNYFNLLGLRPVIGRLLGPDDDRAPAAHPVVVISHRLWQNRLGGDPGVVGRKLILNKNEYTVIGVAPVGYSSLLLDWGKQPDVWAPLMMQPQVLPTSDGVDLLRNRDARWLMAFGRLKQEVRFEQGRAEVETLAAQLMTAWPGHNAGRKGILLPANQARFWPEYRKEITQTLAMLSVLAALVLLVACFNVANLLLARATARKRETAVRMALGAGRWRLVRQWLTESLLLSLLGSGVGILIAAWLMEMLVKFPLPLKIQLAIAPRLDWRILGYTMASGLAAGLIFGLAPAWRAAQLNLIGSLKESGDFGGRGGVFNLGNLFVVAQLALSITLLVGAGLLTRSLWKQSRIHPGFDAAPVLVAEFNLDPREFPVERGADFYRRLLERVRALPGVEAASLMKNTPLNQGRVKMPPVAAEGSVQQREQEWLIADPDYVATDYFKTLGVRLIAGRDFDARDGQGSARVAIVNQTLADRLWPKQEALGKRMKFYEGHDAVTVIGVAPDMKYRSLIDPPQPYYYLPFSQHYTGSMILEARVAGEPIAFASAVRAAAREADPRVFIQNLSALKEQISQSLSQPRIAAIFSALLGVLGLLLAAMGLYGLMAYSVSRRSREIGVRIALGAESRHVLLLTLYQGMRLALLGTALGLLASIPLTRLLRTMLYGVAEYDPATLVGISLLLFVVALVACWIPARRATRVDPLIALRTD
jgi:macrolide transport system ATP-binding/permease protein